MCALLFIIHCCIHSLTYSQVGTLVFGIFMQVLLDAWGWRYTLMVNGGICLVVGIASGALYRPLPTVHDEQHEIDNDSDSSDDEIDTKALLTESGRPRNNLYGSLSTSVSSKVQTKTIDEEPNFDVETGDEAGCCKRSPCGPCNSAFCRVLGETFDPTLFKNPIFVLFTISLLGFSFGYHTPYTYVPERAIAFGIAPTKASLLISIMGISNVLARLLFGWIADKSEKIRFYFAGTVFCLGGIFTILVFLYETYAAMVVYSIVFGACSGML